MCFGVARQAEAIEADRVLDRVAAVVRSAPPAGFTAADVDGFRTRHRSTLVGVVDAALRRVRD